MNPRGVLPVLILQVLAEGRLHGYGIAKQIKQRSSGVLEFQEGLLYPTLHEMERDGFLVSTPEKVGGRIRRYYKITQAGRTALETEREAWLKTTRGVRAILGET